MFLGYDQNSLDFNILLFELFILEKLLGYNRCKSLWSKKDEEEICCLCMFFRNEVVIIIVVFYSCNFLGFIYVKINIFFWVYFLFI